MTIDLSQMLALAVVLLPVLAMLIDMAFHRRLLKKLRKEALEGKAANV